MFLVSTNRWHRNLVLLVLSLSLGVTVVVQGSVALLWVNLVSAIFWVSFVHGVRSNREERLSIRHARGYPESRVWNLDVEIPHECSAFPPFYLLYRLTWDSGEVHHYCCA